MCERTLVDLKAKLMSLTMAAALGLSALVTTSQAGTLDETVSQRVVRYADLNLSTREGVATLYRRIRSAAYMTCGETYGRDIAVEAAVAACVGRATAEAVSAVGSPLLTSYYLDKTGAGKKPIEVASLH